MNKSSRALMRMSSFLHTLQRISRDKVHVEVTRRHRSGRRIGMRAIRRRGGVERCCRSRRRVGRLGRLLNVALRDPRLDRSLLLLLALVASGRGLRIRSRGLALRHAIRADRLGHERGRTMSLVRKVVQSCLTSVRFDQSGSGSTYHTRCRCSCSPSRDDSTSQGRSYRSWSSRPACPLVSPRSRGPSASDLRAERSPRPLPRRNAGTAAA